MTNRSKRNLGAVEAQKDENFETHFVEIHNLHKIIDNDSDIVYGLKGSGKTALCRGLVEIHKDKFLTTKTINLDNISFSQIHSALIKLKDTTNKEIIKLASHTWYNVLLIYSIEEYAKTLPPDSQLKNRIQNFLLNKNYTNSKSNNRLITFIQNLIIRIKEAGYEDNQQTPLGLSNNQFEELDKTLEDELKSIIISCNEILCYQNKKVLICLDGFDSIIDHSEESRKAIFAGLVDAIYKCSKDVQLSKIFCYKAFLPKEITEDVINVHFDADKHIFNTHYLYWSESELEELIQKRLFLISKSKSTSFKDLWNEHLPDKIHNSVHNIEENTFKYILRHTLYRPRHLLIQLQNIFDEWDLKHTSQKIDPSYIPKIVCKTNTILSDLIASELEFSTPGIKQFLHSWNAMSCTITVGQFVDRIIKMFNLTTREEQRILFDRLYNMGIMGFIKKSDLNKKTNNFIACNYSYANSRLGYRMIFNSLENEDIIALSPIFQEYCGCEFSNYGYITQK